jgi:hypothetical protein
MDALVHDFTVTTGVRFNANGTTTPQIKYTFYVGAHGPFTLTYDQGKDTTSQVQMDIQTQVQKLRDVGACPAY